MYTQVFVAGTFDGLHKGHRFLLSEAFRHGEKVTIGVTSDAFVRKFKIFNVQFSVKISNFPSERLGTGKLKIREYEERKKELTAWLTKEGYLNRATVVAIDDPCEPTVSSTGVDALVVTSETRMRGEEINRIRKERGLPPLTLIAVPLVSADDGKPISSSRMRNGEIDRHGRLVMPESLRPILQQPLGSVLRGRDIEKAIVKSRRYCVITVGDVTTKTFLDAGRVPDVSIIDGRVGRKPYHEAVKRLQPRRVRPFEANSVKSGPGYISVEAVAAIKKSIPVIEIDGEEDLLVLPAVIHAPLGAWVYYGQPDEGMVEVPVNTATKQTARRLLGSFLLQSQ